MKVADAARSHWVNRTPETIRPYLQLSRLDRPVGYWLLALPGWIGLLVPAWLCRPDWQLIVSPLYWAGLILVGAIAMRGAGCSYNDIVDRDLDAQVERTQSRPLPSGRISVKQAWIWLALQLAIGFAVWLALPLGAKIVALAALPLVAAYPFMKRITWWPQVWLGLTFNWAVLVAYAIKTGGLDLTIGLIYLGLACWTVGYDTIYALQDIEDDAMIGVRSTARRFGVQVKRGVAVTYGLSVTLIAVGLSLSQNGFTALAIIPFAAHLARQVVKLDKDDYANALSLFQSNVWAAFWLITGLVLTQL
ncbi:4-hydroxybenzoate octaprenyltransferase [Algimonas porphyrae]|uniref:4-hydroxybenzoate octaprenyltransferase n=1 Tax=Algimonas porphyrae TaxID=1128113 RepID=A0ABQ5V3T7_9PROT|nr:4-hydroxybenzoate octaprenyltransferase [Algimonas porphyrae]GLQ21745.1 4-hydroxybenzoate octaprenyltransferase [Algimonas porphyrae]